MFHLLLAIIYLSFISLGLPDPLLGAAWPTMYQQFDVPVSYAGIISMIISLGTIVSSLQSDRLTRKLGTGKVTAISVAMTAVALFGFSTSSSAAALPLNMETTSQELGVDESVASFVLPLGMTVNMNGTAIMQVVATLFVAGCGGYDVTPFSLLVIMALALIASAGTPAAPGAGAIILFTILSGVGMTNDSALMAYSLILAINRPIEMLCTSLNVVGDSCTCLYVAKSENLLNEEVYNANLHELAAPATAETA